MQTAHSLLRKCLAKGVFCLASACQRQAIGSRCSTGWQQVRITHVLD